MISSLVLRRSATIKTETSGHKARCVYLGCKIPELLHEMFVTEVIDHVPDIVYRELFICKIMVLKVRPPVHLSSIHVNKCLASFIP